MRDPRSNIPGKYIEHGAIAFTPAKSNIDKELEALRKQVEDNSRLMNKLIELLQQQPQVSTESSVNKD